MKKTLFFALALIMVLAISSFADVSFNTANSVGVGKWAVLGLYGSNHIGSGPGQAADLSYLDMTNLGVRAEYGVMENLDLLAAYSMDTLPNLVSKFPNPLATVKVTAANTMGLGVKYSCYKATDMIPVDCAVGFGYQSSVQTFTGMANAGVTTYALAGIFSKKMGMYVPYGAIVYKSLTQNAQPGSSSIGGIGLQLNIGCYVGVADNQAVAIEYNTENDKWTDATVANTNMNNAYSNSVSGLSLGYVYMF